VQVGPESLIFPVLVVNPRGDVSVVADVGRIEVANSLALRQGYFDGLQLIQRNGDVFDVATVTPVGPSGPFWGFRFMKPRLVKTRIVLVPAGTYSLEQVKDKVVEAVKKRPHSWVARVDIDDMSQIEARIHSATSIDEILSVVA
jgi:hypothetical protein